MVAAQVFVAGFWTGAAQGAADGGGVMACIGMGGAEDVGIGDSLPRANVQTAAPIMAPEM
jgi:hypothetical protein